MNQPKAGDILFYHPHLNPIDLMIAAWTRSLVTHCEVAISTTQSIGAIADGVHVHEIANGDQNYALWSYPVDNVGLFDGMVWLNKQVGDSYGWSDIILDIDAHNPIIRWLSRIPSKGYDCSDLCTRFLIETGRYPSLSKIDPATVTPAALYRMLFSGRTL